ncbi:MAG TPA: hypothetical protein VKB00_03720 [Candidatus Limnocylindrales bacterium]|jgi:hypothetical protein|nr:hypothetical protein [Candidatus Limnocylindrales bacterium]
MEARTKRTYRLSSQAQSRVRELSSRYGLAESQDAVVEVAIDRLYRDVEARAEGDRWAEAARDPEFQKESSEIARAFGRDETWPA